MNQVTKVRLQQEQVYQEVMQTNVHKNSTRDRIKEAVLREIPGSTGYIRIMTNGGSGNSALQLEEDLAAVYPCVHIDSIECFGHKIKETFARLRQLNNKFQKSFFQMLRGFNDKFDKIKGIDISLGYDLIWYDGVSRFCNPHLRWLRTLKKAIKRGIFDRAWSSGYSPVVCMTVATSGRGARSRYDVLKRHLNKHGKWVNKPSSEERAHNIIQGIHAAFNDRLANINVTLEPVYAEVYRGVFKSSSTPMALIIWRVKQGKFQGQMFERIVNNISNQIKTQLTVQARQLAKKFTKENYYKLVSDPTKYAARLHKSLPKNSGIKVKGSKLHCSWLPDHPVINIFPYNVGPASSKLARQTGLSTQMLKDIRNLQE